MKCNRCNKQASISITERDDTFKEVTIFFCDKHGSKIINDANGSDLL